MKKLAINNKAVLITGAGSGIGRATAYEFAKHGAKLIISDINAAGLQETYASLQATGASVEQHILDVSNRAEQAALAEHVAREYGALTVLVNNAGIAFMGKFLEVEPSTWDKAIEVNLKGIINGCAAFLPAMVAAGKPAAVVNMASMAAFVAAPDLSVYSTTKFGVLGFSESLRSELYQHDISVSAICPGIINTPIVANSVLEGSTTAARDKIQAAYNKRNYGPEKVAQAIVKAAIKRKAVLPVSPEAWITYLGKRLAPNISARVSRFTQNL